MSLINERSLFLLLVFCLWASILYVLKRWRNRPEVIVASMVGLIFAGIAAFLGTSAVFDDMVSGHEDIALLGFGVVHAVVFVWFAVRYALSTAFVLTGFVVLVESATVVVLLATWLIIRFGYI